MGIATFFVKANMNQRLADKRTQGENLFIRKAVRFCFDLHENANLGSQRLFLGSSDKDLSKDDSFNSNLLSVAVI